MYQIIFTALSAVFNWLIRGVVVKFVVFTALSYIVSYIIEYMLEKVDLGSMGSIADLLNGLPAGFLYYFGLFRFDVGIPLVIAAMFLRFGIRRLPIIG